MLRHQRKRDETDVQNALTTQKNDGLLMKYKLPTVAKITTENLNKKRKKN